MNQSKLEMLQLHQEFIKSLAEDPQEYLQVAIWRMQLIKYLSSCLNNKLQDIFLINDLKTLKNNKKKRKCYLTAGIWQVECYHLKKMVLKITTNRKTIKLLRPQNKMVNILKGVYTFTYQNCGVTNYWGKWSRGCQNENKIHHQQVHWSSSKYFLHEIFRYLYQLIWLKDFSIWFLWPIMYLLMKTSQIKQQMAFIKRTWTGFII